MDEYKIIFQGMLPAHGSTPTVVYTCPLQAKTVVEKGSQVVVNPEAASTVTQTLITSIVGCATSASAAGYLTMFLYPDADALADNEGDATYCLSYLNIVTNKSFVTYNIGLYMPPGSILTAKAYVVNTLALTVLGIETTT